MATLYVLSVFDRAAEAYMQPMFVPAKGLAVRSFMDEVNRAAENNPLYMHPDDYQLTLLAVFDSATGVFDGMVMPEVLMTGQSARSRS